MNQDDRLGGALQENILTVLCFDDKNAKLVRGTVTPQLFESAVFREIAGHAIDFIDQYDEPIKEHLPDQLEHILKGDDERKAKSYQRLLDNLYTSRDSVNADYVLSQLHKFVRMQTFKSSLIKAVEHVKDGRIDEAEVEMKKGMENQAVAFEAGLDLSSPAAIGTIFDNPEEEGFELGIPELDRLGIIPRRKELYSFIAPRKRGKSWFLTHCAKQAILQRWSVLIISLEMSDRAYGARMLQSFFSISRREAEVSVTRLVKDRQGDLEGLIQEKIERMSLSDPDARGKLVARAGREFKRRKGFKIKSFPMHSLTLEALSAYLDGLERFENFIPDVICLDYPRIMKHDAKNLRIELGQTIAGFRGLVGERNCAGIIVHQGNRSTENATDVSAQDAEEDISIVAASDVVLTYSQTKEEKKLGLARLNPEYIRNAESHLQVLITQSYAIGQFCLDSVAINPEYWKLMEDKQERESSRRVRRRAGDSDDEGVKRRERREDRD